MPANFSDCFMHHSCYGKDGPPNCRNETAHHCVRPECAIPRETFFSGKVAIPGAMIPPWDHSPDIRASTDCWFADETGLDGGTEPEYWGMPIMNDALTADKQRETCCGYCLADPECLGAQLYG